MATNAKDAAPNAARQTSVLETGRASIHALRPRRPEAGLPPGVEHGVSYLQFIAGEDDHRVAQLLVHESLRRQSSRTAPFLRVSPFSVLNRRRRAARMWVNAIFAGDVSAPTLRALTNTWLPQLAGTGPDAWRAIPAGRCFVEFLRGALTASVMTEAMPCLLRHAQAIHALESVLAIHLGAVLSLPRPAIA